MEIWDELVIWARQQDTPWFFHKEREKKVNEISSDKTELAQPLAHAVHREVQENSKAVNRAGV